MVQLWCSKPRKTQNFNLASIHPTKSSLRCVGGIFLLRELVGATPLHLLSQTALPLKSPTGAFIAPLRCANASLPRGRRNRLISLAKKTGSSRWGTPCLTYRVDFCRVRPAGAHPVFVLSESTCGLFFWRIIRFNTQHPVADPHMGLNQMQRMCA